jgi:hypothetical protein
MSASSKLYVCIKRDLTDCYVTSDCTLIAVYLKTTTMTINRHLSVSNPCRVKDYMIWWIIKVGSRRGKSKPLVSIADRVK